MISPHVLSFIPLARCGLVVNAANCYRNSLRLAVDNRIRSIAFPAISCGAYRYPIRNAAKIAVETTRDFLATIDKIEKVIFVAATEEILEAYQQLL